MLNTGISITSWSSSGQTEQGIKTGLDVDVLMQLFDYIDYPIFLVDYNGHSVWSNQQGSQAIRSQRTLMIRSQRVVPVDGGYDRRWRECLSAASAGDETLLFIDNGIRGQAVSINPLSCSGVIRNSESELTYGLLVIILGKEAPCEPLALRRFSRTYKITLAEQRIVAQLMSGLAPDKIASNNSVTLSTVRSHIKSILAKTGIGSMRDLILSLSRLPPINMTR